MKEKIAEVEKTAKVEKPVIVEVVLNSGVVVSGELIRFDKIANYAIPNTPNALIIKQDFPLLKKIYKDNSFIFTTARTGQGSAIPLYTSKEYFMSIIRQYTIATVFPSTIKSLIYK